MIIVILSNFCLFKCSYFDSWMVSIRPFFKSGTYHGMVISVRPFGFSALFSYILWAIELKFCIQLCSDVSQSSYFLGFRQFLNELCLFLDFEYLFPHFFSTCFDVLSWNYVYGFVVKFTFPRISSIFEWVMLLFGLRILVFCTFSYILWPIDLKFCIWLCNHVP